MPITSQKKENKLIQNQGWGMSYFILILFIISSALAALENLQVKNLNLDYVSPQGAGLVEKLSIGMSVQEIFNKQSYSFEIYRREDSFDVLSAYADFQWLYPIAFVHNLQKLNTEKFNLKIDRGEHFLRGESLRFTPQKGGDYFFRNFSLDCNGSSELKKVSERLKADCLDKMHATVTNMELPFQFLTDIADQLPDTPTETDDIPANDFFLSLYKGDFFSYVRIKYIVKAYLKIWGHVQYENEGKTLAIRIDSIKYGVLPVTDLVMAELRRQIHHSSISINPPWIRITHQ